MRPAILVDIDGVVADASARVDAFIRPQRAAGQSPNWGAFFASMGDDKPMTEVIEMIDGYVEARANRWRSVDCLFVTGRPDNYRDVTVAWLAQHVPFYDPRLPLFMREADDRTDDDELKRSMLGEIRQLGYTPIMAFDDRLRIVKMYIEEGVLAIGINPEDF